MKTVIYNSKLANLLLADGYAAIMLFGLIFVKGTNLSQSQLEHEKVHQGQFMDCFSVGLIFAIITMFVLLTFDIVSWWMLLLSLIPIGLFYVLYGIEWLTRFIQLQDSSQAYLQVSFEREAYDLQDEYKKPCAERRSRHSFSWFKYYRRVKNV